MDQRIPPVLTRELEQHLSSVHRRVPALLRAFYLVGSIALDEFNPDFSDVDFVAVLDHPATAQEINSLHEIHKKIEKQYPRWQLSGVYLLENALGKEAREVEDSIGYHDGKLKVHTNFELNPITWWTLKYHGIPVLGPDPDGLPITIDLATLLSWTHTNTNSYWKSWTRRPIRLMALFTDWGIQWTVLGMLRQLYTLRENKITTKQRAGEYGLCTVPSQWHPIISEAIRIRTKGVGSLYRSKLRRAIETRGFLNYLILASNDYLEGRT